MRRGPASGRATARRSRRSDGPRLQRSTLVARVARSARSPQALVDLTPDQQLGDHHGLRTGAIEESNMLRYQVLVAVMSLTLVGSMGHAMADGPSGGYGGVKVALNVIQLSDGMELR